MTSRGLGVALVDARGVPRPCCTAHQMDKWSLLGRRPHREGPRSGVGDLEKQTRLGVARTGCLHISEQPVGGQGLNLSWTHLFPYPEMCPPQRVLMRLKGHHLRKVLAFTEWLLYPSSQHYILAGVTEILAAHLGPKSPRLLLGGPSSTLSGSLTPHTLWKSENTNQVPCPGFLTQAKHAESENSVCSVSFSRHSHPLGDQFPAVMEAEVQREEITCPGPTASQPQG